MDNPLSGMLASAVLKVALENLAAATMPDDEKLRRHMLELKERMEAMAEVVGDAETRSASESGYKERWWLIRLQDIAYGVWDMVDEIQANKRKQVRRLCFPFASALKGSSIVTGMNKAKEELDLLQQELGSFAPPFSVDKQRGNVYQSYSPDDAYYEGAGLFVDDEDSIHVGMHRQKQRMLDIILSAERDSSTGLSIVPICGREGVGKTTLAKMVFSDAAVVRDYARAWVTVGPEFDLKKIGNCILSQLSKQCEHQNSSDVELIMKRLDELLLGGGGKNKLLVVLDDLSSLQGDGSGLFGLRRMLGAWREDSSKVVVMVTTCNQNLVWKLASGGEVIEMYELDMEDSRHLIARKHDFATTIPDDEILDEVLSKCSRVPLAIHAIGSTLRFKRLEQIRSFLTSEIWTETCLYRTHRSPLVAELLLSYIWLPPNLRLCFAYCAIFPRGYSILKEDLIHHWIALQLIEPADTFSTTQLAHRYIGKLLDMSFLQPTVHPSVGTRSLSAMNVPEKTRRLIMNNVVNDFARYVLDEKLVVVDGRNNMATSSLYVNSRSMSGLFASVRNVNATLDNLLTILPGAGSILSLCFVDCSNIKIGDGAFSSAKKLQILDLRGCLDNDFLEKVWPDSGTPPPTEQPLTRCSMGKLPESIGQLKNLRYLCAPAIEDRVFPLSIINGLSRCLRYLSLRCSRHLSDLTEAFGSMESLVHLDLSGCPRLKSLPEGACWRSLQHLDLSGCSGLKSLPKSFGALVHLDLSGCSGLKLLPESFGACCWSLLHLDLSGCSGLKSLPESLMRAFWCTLLHLDLSGCTGLKTLPRSIRTVGSSSINLRHLDLSGCSCSCLQGITEALSACTDLRYLNLSHRCGYFVEDWFHLKGLDVVLPTLKKLRFLGIASCLDPICYAMPPDESQQYVDCITRLEKLEYLDLSQNKFLRHLPQKIGALKVLRTLDPSMYIHFKPESLQGLVDVTKPRVLDISGCLQLNSIKKDMRQHLRKLTFLKSREWLTGVTGPCSQAAGSKLAEIEVLETPEGLRIITGPCSQAASSQEELGAETEFLESPEWQTIITSPCSQSAGSQEELGANQAQECPSMHSPRCYPAATMDLSASEPEITEVPENQ